jgi:hypothetical protein
MFWDTFLYFTLWLYLLRLRFTVVCFLSVWIIVFAFSLFIYCLFVFFRCLSSLFSFSTHSHINKQSTYIHTLLKFPTIPPLQTLLLPHFHYLSSCLFILYTISMLCCLFRASYFISSPLIYIHYMYSLALLCLAIVANNIFIALGDSCVVCQLRFVLLIYFISIELIDLSTLVYWQ